MSEIWAAYPEGGSGGRVYLFSPRPDVPFRAGNVNAGAGARTDVLSVNGVFGDEFRCLSIPAGAPISVALSPSPSGPDPADYALYAYPGEADFTMVTPQPFQIGSACFPTRLSGGIPQPLPLANTLGFENRFGGPIFPGTPPAPCEVIFVPDGLPSPVVYTLQGFLVDAGSGGPSFSLTNALVLTIQ